MPDLFTTSSAVLSECGQYRYRLGRRWDEALPKVCWIMLNPSTADASLDDPTIRRCLTFSKRWGFGSLVVVNLFAYRATDPDALKTVVDPEGRANDDAIRMAVAESKIVVAAWGRKGGLRGRDTDVLGMLRGVSLKCLGTAEKMYPKHPLYVRGIQPLVDFTEEKT